MRYVLITSPFVTQPRGSIWSQERLGMNDDKLDEFIAAGFAIECDVEHEAPPPPPMNISPAPKAARRTKAKSDGVGHDEPA